jgi:hypothetical protein
MYYGQLMFAWANNQRTLATCQECVSVWLDGVARQQQAHAAAVSTFYTRQLEDLRALSEATDAAQFASRLLACASPKPVGLTELSTRLGGIFADTHRKLGEVVGSHADQVTRSWLENGAELEEPPRKDANGGRAGGRRQMVA